MKKLYRKTTAYVLMISSIFIWVGFVCAISFMEAWLKFRAPNVTLAIGLGIGKLVFAALNQVECVLSLVFLSGLFFGRGIFKPNFLKSIMLYIPICILILQTFWLIPVLDERADKIIQGIPLSPSMAHISYVIAEFIKVFILFILGVKGICQMTKTYQQTYKKEQDF